jgi:hypothetical protein
MKNIIIKLTKVGNRISEFLIKDNFGNTLIPSITKSELSDGVSLSIEDNVTFIDVLSLSKSCCKKEKRVFISQITNTQLAAIETEKVNTTSVWEHLTTPLLYNDYYGCINPYIIEYPFAYKYQDELIQNVKDYTKVYKYLVSTTGNSNDNRKIQPDDAYFNKSIIYNDQQSSGILELETKPANNIKSYLSYPKYNTTSKTIIYTKSDNFYQYNTFWSIVKDKIEPLFIQSCESLSIDKEVNQDNMDYTNIAFRKAKIKAKDSKIRQILDNRNDVLLVSQFITQQSQLSYK